ncbi:hypothetical protein V5O48_003794 [Marasmius crinis-equi]|uniref:Uncharacterized protein n=1 Tax=Marasmius crinis-equi TaxID=585013 RepID=A0ABR3FRX4_9AGAR
MTTYVRSRFQQGPSLSRWAEVRHMLVDTLLQVAGLDMFLPLFTAAELSRMLTVSRKFHHNIDVYRRRLHNIDKLLLMFFTLSEIRLFRDIQACDGFLISGSLALQYFAGVVWPDSDLDIYCYPGTFTRLTYFLRRIGYGFTPAHAGSTGSLESIIQYIEHGVGTFGEYTNRAKAILAVLSFERCMADSTRKIQVVVCINSPMEAILHFHSSKNSFLELCDSVNRFLPLAAVMNFIGPTHAVSLYPYSTLHLFEAIRLVPVDSASAAFQKYSERGWNLVGCGSALSGLRRANEFVHDRAVGDPATWIIALRGIDMPSDRDSVNLKWILAHSWSHTRGSRGVVRITAQVGGRCSWRWPLTFANICQHLKLHGPDLQEDCDVCENAPADEYDRGEDVYDLVHKAVESSPRIGDTAVDNFAVEFLRHAFGRVQFLGPVHSELLPDSDVAMNAFMQLKAVLYYFRSEPKITVSFHLEGRPFVLTSFHVYLTLGSVSRTVAMLKCNSYRRPKADSGLSFKLVFPSSPRQVCLSADFVMPRFNVRSSVNGPRDRPTEVDAQTIDRFILDTLNNSPQRPIGAGEIVPLSASYHELRECLYALFTILNCSPELVVRYSRDIGERTDIQSFAEIGVRLPEYWPDLEDTALGVNYNMAAVHRLHRLGFSVTLTKGGKLFM